MSAARPGYFITTPIYYVNDKPHIGHAYTTMACDALARFKRLDGHPVFFLTGTDEHGQKVQRSAEAAGLDPQTFTDRVAENFRALTRLMNFSNDDFIRTSEPRHKSAVQHLWQMLAERGEIYLGTYAGWYAVRDEAYYGEDELTLTPSGKRIAPSGAECDWVEEESWFFRLSAWSDRLLAFYEANPDFILPRNRRNEVLAFVGNGLKDLSISRTTYDWGIRVPGSSNHVMYVWFDALTNYLTALGWPQTEPGSLYDRFWPADLHMVGKDILRFHAIYWPAFLMAADLPVPRRVFAHGWWTIEGQKMSKSLGNVVAPEDLVSTYGLDPTRYFLLREVAFGQDGNFSREAMVQRINTDLANDLGNLCQRVLSQVAKNCGAAVPQPGPMQEADAAMLASADHLLPEIRSLFDAQAFHRALEQIWAVIGEANRYVDAMAPWALRKTDPERMATVLYVLCEVIRSVGILVQPVMPDSAAKILDQLSLPPEARVFAALGRAGALTPGTPLPPPAGVFPRFVAEA